MDNNLTILRIKDFCGLYDELYNPNPYVINEKICEIKDGRLDLCQNYWALLLSKDSIAEILKIGKLNVESLNASPQLLSAINDPNRFIENVEKAKVFICDHGISQQAFFSYIETLTIVCELYNIFKYKNFTLTINDGFILNESSSKELYFNCLNPNNNPLFSWIYETVIPLIVDYNPDVIFCDGRPSMIYFCIAKIIKNMNPNCHISITNNSSEYFSLSKIKKYLIKNEYLFRIFDSLILDEFDSVEIQLLDALLNHRLLNDINNLMYKDKDGTIKCNTNNKTKQNKSLVFKIRPQNTITDMNFSIPPSNVADAHILPHHKCYWNKCTFCGINKKYLFSDTKDSTDDILYNNLKKLKENIVSNEIKYVWFIDEALPPNILYKIANFFIEEKVNVVWQARCRIEEELIVDELPELLLKSGLKELRLGLESASKKVLHLMNKFPNDFDLNTVTKIVSYFNKLGINIHFPMIIGFPGETDDDRRITYEYLTFLKNNYKHFSFNINLLSLDVSSELFNKWDEFNIDKMEFPCSPNEFLGNITIYDQMLYSKLSHERDVFMRGQLYPWYPIHSYTKPHIFYRLTETIRNTLVWINSQNMINKTSSETLCRSYILEENISISKTDNGENYIYNWNNHRFILVDNNFLELLNLFKTEQRLKDICNTYQYENIKNQTFNDYISTIKKLVEFGFLNEVNKFDMAKHDDNLEIANYYDMMYSADIYNYDIKNNIWLRNNISYVAKGEVLDIGIGCGQNIEFIQNNGFSIYGIDISSVAIKKLKEKYPDNESKFICGDITQIDIGINRYSLIICSMSLHYLEEENFENVINKIKKALIKGGYLYISVLSKEDALNKTERNSLIKQFFSKEDIISYFNDMQIVELNENIHIDTIRKLDFPFWGVLTCVFKK